MGSCIRKKPKQKKIDPADKSELIKSNEEDTVSSNDKFRDEKSSNEFNSLFEKRKKEAK